MDTNKQFGIETQDVEGLNPAVKIKKRGIRLHQEVVTREVDNDSSTEESDDEDTIDGRDKVQEEDSQGDEK